MTFRAVAVQTGSGLRATERWREMHPSAVSQACLSVEAAAKKKSKKGKGAGLPPEMGSMGGMMIMMMDRDGDGKLTKEEFIRHDMDGPGASEENPQRVGSPEQMFPMENQEEMFGQMDSNGDGVVTKDEAEAIFGEMEKMMGSSGCAK